MLTLLQLTLLDEELLRTQLTAQCPSLSPTHLPDFVSFWQALSSAQLECVRSAASAHLRFLRLSPERMDDRTLGSALVLLHLLLRHPSAVEPLLSADASASASATNTSTPPPPASKSPHSFGGVCGSGSGSGSAMDAAVWTQVVPQLVAQLTHPDARVRRVVSALLVRVAARAAHLVLYPVVVGERLAQEAGLSALDGYSTILQQFELWHPG